MSKRRHEEIEEQDEDTIFPPPSPPPQTQTNVCVMFNAKSSLLTAFLVGLYEKCE